MKFEVRAELRVSLPFVGGEEVMIYKLTTIRLMLVIGLATCANSVLAQAKIDFTINSQQKARQVLDDSIKAFGGLNAVNQARNFSLRITGTSWQLFQSKDPEKPHHTDPINRTIVIESDKNRLFNDTSFTSPAGDFVFRTKDIIKNGEGHTIFTEKNHVMKMREPSLSNYQNLYNLLPQNILIHALQRNATLRWLGNDDLKGRKQDVIAFTLRNGQVWNLYFDFQTRLLTKHTWFYTKNVWGDTMGEFVFTGYRDSQGTKVPITRVSIQGGVLKSEMHYHDVIFDPQIKDSFYDLPSGLTELNTVPPKTEVLTLAPKVFLLRSLAGGFNVLAVEFDNFILAGEAPEEDVVNGISAEAVELIKKTIPNKPIKYVVLTHFHHDHFGGVRAFISEGARVITTPGNVSYLSRIANAPFSFAPDLLARKPREMKIETFSGGKRIIKDDNQTVEIYEIGPINHSNEMLMIYLPKEKILFQSDLFNPIKPGIVSTEDDPYHGINAKDSESLLNSIRKLGLDVEKIAGSHGRISTMAELIEEVEKNKSAKSR